MRRIVDRYLALPAFPNDEARSHARLLQTLWLHTLPLLLIALVVLPFSSERTTATFVVVFVILAALLPVPALLRRGNVLAASILYVGTLWLAAAFMLVLSSPVTSAEAVVLAMITIISGLLLGRRVSIGLAILSSVLVLGIAILDSAGYPLQRYFSASPLVYAIILVLGLYLTLVAVNQALRVVSDALHTARRELFDRRHAESTLRLTIQQMGAIVWTTDTHMCFTSFQGAALADLRLQQDETIGLRMDEYWRDDAPQLIHAVDRALHGESATVEHTWAGRYYTTRIEPLRDTSGQIAGSVAVMLDTTASKRAEEALRESRAKYDQLVELGMEAIVLIDNETGRILEANGATTEMYGYSHDELLALRNVDLSAEPEATQQVTRTTPVGTSRIVLLRYHRRKNGEVFPVEITGRFFEWQGRGVHVAAIRDITERRRAEAEREAMITELQRKNNELERFTYTVSHDLKSPLITIRGFLGFLKQDVLSGNTDRLIQDIERIHDATSRMERMLTDLLHLSRAGRLVNQPERVAFATIVRDALTLVHGQLAERGVRVEVAPDLPEVFGDRTRLVQVVANLVTNAVRFMGDQPAPCITIGVCQRNGERVFFVADNGIGIAPQYFETIFGLFEKLDRQSEGTGIGLALVRRIIEVHGGRVWVESQGPGTGSCFYFTLPDAPPQPYL